MNPQGEQSCFTTINRKRKGSDKEKCFVLVCRIIQVYVPWKDRTPQSHFERKGILKGYNR